MYSGSMKSKVQYMYQTCVSNPWRVGRMMHPVITTNVYMTLTVAKYHFTPK